MKTPPFIIDEIRPSQAVIDFMKQYRENALLCVDGIAPTKQPPLPIDKRTRKKISKFIKKEQTEWKKSR